MNKKWMIVPVLAMALAGCGADESATTEETSTEEADAQSLRVYTTIYPLEYFTERIGGDTVNVESIVPPGADEHTFEPTSKTMIELADADLFLYNGLGLEPFAESVSETITAEGAVSVDIGSRVNLEEAHDHEEEHGEAHEEGTHTEEHAEEGHTEETHAEDSHDSHAEEESVDDGHNHGSTDPHIWLDPMLAVQMADVIKTELTAVNPEQESVYEENFQSLKQDLEELDTAFHEMAEQAAQKEMIVSHAAFGYWESTYGIEQLSVAGLSPTDEPSQKELKELADAAKQHNIQYVLFEQNVTPKIAEVLQNEIGADALRIHNLATLTEEEKEQGKDYLAIMNENIATLKQALNP